MTNSRRKKRRKRKKISHLINSKAFKYDLLSKIVSVFIDYRIGKKIFFLIAYFFALRS
jgi:hypothetical protein